MDGLQSNLTYRFASFDPNVGPAAAFAYTPFSQVDVVFSDLSGIPATNGIVGGWAVYNDSAQYQWLVKPANTVSASFTGLPGTDFSNSTFNTALATQNVNLATDTNFLLTANLAVNSVRYRGPTNGIVNLGGFQLRIGSGGLLHSSPSAGTSTLLITNGTVTAGTGVDRPGTLFFTGGGTNAMVHPIDIPATITDNGTGVVNVVQYNLTAGGSLTLRGTNSYTGFTALDNGDVVFSWDGTNAGDNAPLGKVPAAFVADNIRLAGGRLLVSGNMLLHTNRGIQMGGPGGTIAATGKTFTNNGAISGNGDLTINGGTIVLGGTQPNTYAGNTIVSPNTTLRLAKSGANAIPGNLFIICAANASSIGLLQLNGSEQIADDAVVTLIRPWGSGGASTGTALWQLYGYNETIGGLMGTLALGNTNTSGTVVENGNLSALSNSTLTVNTASGTYFNFQGALRNGNTGVLSVVKTGAGIQELAGFTNTYAGGTLVNGGTLLVNNTAGSGTGTGTVSITSGATLGGAGSITGAVVVSNGTLDPGAYPGTVGTLTVGTLTFQSAGALTVDLSDNTVNDKVVVNGTVTLGGAVNVHLLGGYNPPNGQSWTIMTASGAIDDSVKMQTPTGFRVKKSGAAVILTRVAPGSAILVQ